MRSLLNIPVGLLANLSPLSRLPRLYPSWSRPCLASLNRPNCVPSAAAYYQMANIQLFGAETSVVNVPTGCQEFVGLLKQHGNGESWMLQSVNVMSQIDSCPRCGGMLEYLQDKDGPYLRCFLGCYQKDLLQSPPEELALRMKVPSAQGGIHGRPDGVDVKGHRIDGYHGPQATPLSLRGGRRHDWYGGTRKRWQ